MSDDGDGDDGQDRGLDALDGAEPQTGLPPAGEREPAWDTFEFQSPSGTHALVSPAPDGEDGDTLGLPPATHATEREWNRTRIRELCEELGVNPAIFFGDSDDDEQGQGEEDTNANGNGGRSA